MPVGAGVAGVEQLHRAQVDLAALQREGDPGVQVERTVAERVERLEEVCVDGRVLLAEGPRVVCVRRNALQAVERGLLERLDVLIARGVPRAAELDALRDLALDTRRRREIDERTRHVGACLAGEFLTQTDGLVHLLGDRSRVEVDVGECREERVGYEAAGLGGVDAALRRVDSDRGKPATCVHEQVLEGGDVLLLAAHANGGAGDSPGGLFTLVAEHVTPFRSMVGTWPRGRGPRRGLSERRTGPPADAP
jgi:hypothetical protein